MLAGCGAETVEGEIVGEAELALGEMSCATDATPDDEISSGYCGSEYSISPNTSYGQTDCPSQYLVEFDGSVARIDGFSHGWGDTLPATQSACEKAHSYVTVFERENGTWTKLQGQTFHSVGDWVGSGETAHCEFDAPVVFRNEDADLYRVASRAVQCPASGLCFGTVKKAQGYAFGTPCFW